MARKYDASRREAAAQQTREDILAAAFRLHGLGILDMEALAKEANVSVATVRKHFPTREMLFQGCTAYGMHLIPLPDMMLLAAEPDPAQRTRLAVREVYGMLEQLLGQMWSAYRFEHESPALTDVIRQAEGLCETVADLVISAWTDGAEAPTPLRGLVLGLLKPLGYRALRVSGGLTLDQAVEQSSAVMIASLRVLRKEGAYA